MGKRTIYFNCGIFILLCASFFIPLLSHAQDISDNIYKDPNNYFIFKPPAGWKKEEITNKLTSQVNFRSPDGKATLGILAELDGGNLNYLLFKKRRFVKDHRQRYPEGAFSVSLAVLAATQ